MPYKTVWEDRGIVWHFEGDVTAAEIEAANEEFYVDERSDRARYQIIDALQVTSVEWSDQNITEAAAMDMGAEASIKRVRVAYVATDALIISLLEKYVDISRMMNTSWQFKGFGELSIAKAWVESGE
jgi:hypothetical protein